MTTIISGTNRPDSNTFKVATHYFNIIKKHEQEVNLVSLMHLDILQRSTDFLRIESEYLIPAKQFVIIAPEYNGSYPGVLKTMIDNSDIRKCWWYKKAILVGVADGRGGNLRGLDDLSNILHYLRVHVHYNKLPISKINEELDENGLFKNELTIKAINNQIAEFLNLEQV